MAQNDGPLQPRQYVAYLDLSGGRNTRKDPHAIDRNQLTISDNTWMAQSNTIAKRPGSVYAKISSGTVSGGAISVGATGTGQPGTGMVEGRFAGLTALVVQSGQTLMMAPMTLPAVSVGVNQWVSIGRISSGGTIQATQLFDPQNKNGPDGTLFITTGVDVPLAVVGINQPLTPITYLNPNQIPTKANGSGLPIVPKYCASLFSSLFYAGENTDPSMLYISDPFRPESFTENLVVPTGTITGSSYIGLPVGRGDGVGGGVITGLAPMGSAMIVYKQSAIYAVTQVGLIGDMAWGASVASSSVGCVSPRSIVPFDQFHCFLGIDGVYIFDGYQTTKISANNPDLFDGSFSTNVLCQNRRTAIGVRYGNRYMLFFDDGGGTSTPLGYCNRGVWFDFDKVDADGLPCVGTMSGFNVGGVAPLRGPSDVGNFAWCSATMDAVALFGGQPGGQVVFSDLGAAITTTLAAKADMMVEEYHDEAPLMLKTVDSIDLLMSMPFIQSGQEYTFNGTLTYDQANTGMSMGSAEPLGADNPISLVGQAVVGTATVSSVAQIPTYSYVYMPQPAPAAGNIIQFGWSETSAFPWTSLGFILYVNAQWKVGSQSG